MISQLNKIYLSANHDVLDLLPSTLFNVFEQSGYTVNTAFDVFDSRMVPPKSVNKMIDECDYFILILSPASYIYGFISDQTWFWKTVNRARNKKKHIILILAYGFTLDKLKDRPRLWEGMSDVIEFENNDYASIIKNLSDFIPNIKTSENNLAPTIDFLPAEAMIDKAIIERYNGQLYNRPQQNFEIIENCINLYPTYDRAYFERAKEYRFHRDTEIQARVIADYDKAIELKSDSAEYYALRSETHYDLGNWGHAMADICKAIKLKPRQYLYYSRRATYFFNYPQHQISDYTQAIEINPNDQFLYEGRSQAYENLGEYDKALDDVNTAISVSWSYAEPHYIIQRAFVFLSMGNHEKARSEMELAVSKSIELFGEVDNYILQSQASMYRALRDFDSAIAIYQTLISHEPNDVMHKVHLAQIYMMSSNIDKAFTEYENALEEHSRPQEQSVIYYFRGSSQSSLRNWANAINDYTKAIDLYPKHSEAF